MPKSSFRSEKRSVFSPDNIKIVPSDVVEPVVIATYHVYIFHVYIFFLIYALRKSKDYLFNKAITITYLWDPLQISLPNIKQIQTN